jgi:hypothetical protein
MDYLVLHLKHTIMETSLIEQYDKTRYRLVKWLTIGWTVWYGTYILKDLINNTLITGLILSVGSIGWILFLVSCIRFLKLGKKINEDSKLKEALNNEMYQLYKYKSFFCGFWAMLATICIFLVISIFYQVSASIVCKLTLYVGISSALIAGLVYNKD